MATRSFTSSIRLLEVEIAALTLSVPRSLEQLPWCLARHPQLSESDSVGQAKLVRCQRLRPGRNRPGRESLSGLTEAQRLSVVDPLRVPAIDPSFGDELPDRSSCPAHTRWEHG